MKNFEKFVKHCTFHDNFSKKRPLVGTFVVNRGVSSLRVFANGECIEKFKKYFLSRSFGNNFVTQTDKEYFLTSVRVIFVRKLYRELI